MPVPENIENMLRLLPKVDLLADALAVDVSRKLKISAARNTVNNIRKNILSYKARVTADMIPPMKKVIELCRQELDAILSPSLRPVINATGVVIHTNLGRSPLPDSVLERMKEVALGYSNLEYDLEAGRRGSRYSHVEEILCEISGAEAAVVVNNNAAAVLICLETLARNREVVVSRGELVEIGGSFRIPDVMSRSGAVLHEVGATNRTHLMDYATAISEATALLLKVHQSNFAITGFTTSVSISKLKELGKQHGLPVMEDLGSGTFTDFSRYGMVHEPTVQESVKAGADIVTFSGDKLLGGPQAGIIVGSREVVEKIKKNPMNRAMRIDKLTLAALEGILEIYRDPENAAATIPVLNMLVMSYEELHRKSIALKTLLENRLPDWCTLDIIRTVSRVGGGAMPLQELETSAVTLLPDSEQTALSASKIEQELRQGSPPVVARLENDRLVFDTRTIFEREFTMLADAIAQAIHAP